MTLYISCSILSIIACLRLLRRAVVVFQTFLFLSIDLSLAVWLLGLFCFYSEKNVWCCSEQAVEQITTAVMPWQFTPTNLLLIVKSDSNPEILAQLQNCYSLVVVTQAFCFWGFMCPSAAAVYSHQRSKIQSLCKWFQRIVWRDVEVPPPLSAVQNCFHLVLLRTLGIQAFRATRSATFTDKNSSLLSFPLQVNENLVIQSSRPIQIKAEIKWDAVWMPSPKLQSITEQKIGFWIELEGQHIAVIYSAPA